MKRGSFFRIVSGSLLLASVGVAGVTRADTVYSSYMGSQQGVTLRNTVSLNQNSYFNTGINASGISVDSGTNIYLASGNTLSKYNAGGTLITRMTFPDARINYTDVAVKGGHVYASYTGSQQGFTIRNTTNLAQTRYCNTGINANGIAVDSGNHVYLAAGNQLKKYDAHCRLLVTMTFPDSRINYTGISVR